MIAAGIVLFQPDILWLKENIDAYVNDVEKIYCFDNCSENIADVEDLLKLYKNKIEL